MYRRKAIELLLLGCLFLTAIAVPARGDLFEDFSSGWDQRWTHSTESKYNGKFVVQSPEGLDASALKVPDKARHYGIAAQLDSPLKVAKKGLVAQFELKLSEGLTCGGAYLKYLTSGEFEASGLKDDTPYTVMFGPDKCGATNKVHLILRHKAPNGKIEEKHLRSPPLVNLDKRTHVYTAILNPEDNTYEVLIDGESKKSGSLFEDFDPSINPPEEVDDPKDKKPSDWVENAKMPDPDAKKPDDWDEDAPRQIADADAEKPEGWLDDEPEEIDDPEASQPEDWDVEEDGEWEAPKISNPKCSEAGCGEWKRPQIPNPSYKGKWTADLIDNPAYKGPWAPRKIANPDHFVDEAPLKNLGDVGGVAIEIWTMDDGYYFSNIFVGTDADKAAEYRTSNWAPKKEIEDKLAEEEAEKAKAEVPETEGGGGRKVSEKLTDWVLEQFDRLPEGIRGPIDPFLDTLEKTPYFSFIIVATPILLVLSVLQRLFKRKKPVAASVQHPTTRQAKKGDITGPDDTVAARTANAAKSAAATAQNKASEAAASVSEAAEDDEVEGVKVRRTRRDN